MWWPWTSDPDFFAFPRAMRGADTISPISDAEDDAMTPCSRRTRREFLRTGLAAGTLAMSGALPLAAQRGKATDLVTLGRSGVKVTRLAFGTGSFSGRVQRELGQDGFTRLVRHAYDSGIRFFETAESYGEMHKMLGDRPEGHPARQLPDHVEGDDPGRRRSAEEVRRASHARQHRVLRHHAAALAAHGHLAGRHGALAGRDPARSSHARSCSDTAPPCTACRPCAGFPATTGSRSR